jgi:hypothetical protein
LIYKFRDDPRPGVVQAFKDEAEGKTADTGGGTLEYEPENKGLYLSRSYNQRVSDDDFAHDLERLMIASEVYGNQVLDRVASRVLSQNS